MPVSVVQCELLADTKAPTAFLAKTDTCLRRQQTDARKQTETPVHRAHE